jgi:hypothetical protein
MHMNMICMHAKLYVNLTYTLNSANGVECMQVCVCSYAAKVARGTSGDVFLQGSAVQDVVGLLDGRELRGRVGARELHDHRVPLVDALRRGVRHRSLPLGGAEHPVVHRSLQDEDDDRHRV